MKVRIISALVGLAILAVVLALFNTLVLNLAITVICVVAVIELLTATGCIKFKGLTVLGILMTLIIPFVRAAYLRPYVLETVFLVILAFFLLLLRHSQKMKIEQFALVFLFSTVIPAFYSCAVYLRDDYGAVCGVFYVLTALGSAWLSDTGAYFAGSLFGKHKLAPKVSPKKTVEGAVGGVVSSVVFMLAIAFVYVVSCEKSGYPVQVNYLALAVSTPVFAVIGMLGDLSASVIKRQYGVKDFGNIMPGHGGVLDRFDSVLFTLPAVYMVSKHIDLIAFL